jgi:hypothetical protein
MAVVFFDIGKAFYNTSHLDFICKLSKLKLVVGRIELIGSFLSERKLRVSVERELSTPKKYTQERAPQGFVLPPTFHIHICA